MSHRHHPAPPPPNLTRRGFLQLGAVGLAGVNLPAVGAQPGETPPRPARLFADLDYLTQEKDFRNVGRGKPPPHELPLDKRRAAGLLPETWQLEVVPDPASDANLERPLSREAGRAVTWDALIKLAASRAVRFLHVMSCTNMSGPLGMGLWEGVPLRDVIWLARPTANVRRVCYHGYHNDDPQQLFQSSLTMDRVLEDPPGELPVIVCYKLNGEWLTPKRGGPVRMIVPGAYGNKSVKWLTRVLLTNIPQLNDTYARWNNDTESQLKTCAVFLEVPKKLKAGQPVTVTGTAQVGMSALSQVQYWLRPENGPLADDDPYFTKADWRDAVILSPPERWGGGLPNGQLPPVPLQFDGETGKPRHWPLRYTIVHWVAHFTVSEPGRYDLRCRTIDANGVAQPMPRPFLKSGHNAIHRVPLVAEA